MAGLGPTFGASNAMGVHGMNTAAQSTALTSGATSNIALATLGGNLAIAQQMVTDAWATASDSVAVSVKLAKKGRDHAMGSI